MTRRSWFCAIAVSASVLAWPVTTAGVGVAAAAAPSVPMNCASLTLTAAPRVNAQTAPFETIKNVVTSCAATTETVRLTQQVSGPFTPDGAPSRTWVFTLAPGQSALRVQHVPYSCCGTYTLKDRVTASGVVLTTKSTSFTFA